MADPQQTIDRILDGVDERCLQIFACSLKEAHRYGSDKWGVTLNRGDRARLVVGSLIVCTLHIGAIWLALDKNYEGTPAYTVLAGSHDWKWTQAYRYQVIPSISGYYKPSDAENYTKIWPKIREMHFALIEGAASKYTRLRRPSQRAHSDAFLQSLRERLKQSDIPAPNYRKQ